MKAKAILLAFVLALICAAPAMAGKCSHDTQACLDYLTNHVSKQGYVGVELDREHGIANMTVTEVRRGTPAAQAGLEVGDRLVAVNGIRFTDKNEETLHALQATMEPGSRVEFTIDRDGHEKRIALTLVEMPDDVMARMIGRHMLQHAAIELASSE